ncbi:MAG: hypothetical protein AB7N76_07470 [Planctomycetota bacterium]
MAESPPGLEELVAARTERGLLWQAAGCFGCLGLIAGVFVLMALGITGADRVTFTEPAAVEENLQAIVACRVPEGYRGFRGLDKGGRRIAMITPHTHSGLRVPVAGRLTIAVWTLAPGTSRQAAEAELLAYWREKLSEHYGPGVEVPAPKEVQGLTLKVRGAALPAREWQFVRGEEHVRLLAAFVPRAPGGEEEVAVAGIGNMERFDQAALDAFLESIK